ncbi:MAG: hypothetical protein GY799_10995 [Desulfobulbaceae bacterium]|nr:hypothetical protein [Desulfobulbaceae bacterium]
MGFYCIGFAEVLTAILGPEFILSSRIIASLAVGGIFIIAWMGARAGKT